MSLGEVLRRWPENLFLYCPAIQGSGEEIKRQPQQGFCTLGLGQNHCQLAPPPTWQEKLRGLGAQTPEDGSIPPSSGCLWPEGWEAAEAHMRQWPERSKELKPKREDPRLLSTPGHPPRTSLAKVVKAQRRALHTCARTQSTPHPELPSRGASNLPRSVPPA